MARLATIAAVAAACLGLLAARPAAAEPSRQTPELCVNPLPAGAAGPEIREFYTVPSKGSVNAYMCVVARQTTPVALGSLTVSVFDARDHALLGISGQTLSNILPVAMPDSPVPRIIVSFGIGVALKDPAFTGPIMPEKLLQLTWAPCTGPDVAHCAAAAPQTYVFLMPSDCCAAAAMPTSRARPAPFQPRLATVQRDPTARFR